MAKLPAINDESANNIVLAMDELQFLFCKQADTLITRYAMDPLHKQYLDSIGFSFINNQKDIADRRSEDTDTKSRSIFQLLSETGDKEYIKSIIPAKTGLSPFGVIPGSEETARTYSLMFKAPALGIIKNVNSKVYSTHLNEKMGRILRIVSTSEELAAAGSEYLKEHPIIIKDDYGVSGKGNLFIDSPAILDRITAYVAKQEKKGKRVCFIIEPWLDRELDFSCQFFITLTGGYKLLSLQKIINKDFSYQGSFSPGEDFTKSLADNGYFDVMEKTANCLFDDGYYGHVCVDSMLLKNREIVPVVEINARKSMSLLKSRLDHYVEKISQEAGFTFLSISYKGSTQFGELMEKAEKEKLLFKPGAGQGIIPLGANSLFINRDMDKNFDGDKIYKGRFYFASIDSDEAAILEMNLKTKAFLESAGFKILN